MIGKNLPDGLFGLFHGFGIAPGLCSEWPLFDVQNRHDRYAMVVEGLAANVQEGRAGARGVDVQKPEAGEGVEQLAGGLERLSQVFQGRSQEIL